MTPTLRQMLARSAAVLLTVAAAAVPAGRGAAAEPCGRTLTIQPEVTAGEGAGTLTLKVTSGGCPVAGTVGYTVTAGSAVPGADFTLPSGTLRWAAGDTGTRRIVAEVVDDHTPEATLEDFTVQLTAPSIGLTVLHGTGTARICDDSLGLVWVLDGGVSPMLGPGYLCPPPSTPLTFVWQTEDGTARAGVDYVAVTGRTQTVPAGVTRFKLDVTLLFRPADIPSRWFTVRIVAVSAGTVADAVAVVTIDGP